MELETFIRCIDWGDAVETLVASVIILAYVTGNIQSSEPLVSMFVLAAAVTIFGDKVYKYRKAQNGGNDV